MRRLISALFFCACIFGPLSLARAENAVPELTTTAGGAVLMEAHNGSVLWEKDPHLRQPIASMVKIMTLLLAVEAVEQGKVELTDTVTASEYAAGMGGSQIYLAPQEQMSLRELLISIATGSANDASVAVAEHVAGSAEAFVGVMNERARELGLKDTCYVNPTGLPAPGQYSSAHDQAVLLREALKHSLFRELTRMKEYDLRDGQFKLWNTNKLLWWYKGADSGKTGWTNEAGYCLASSAVREGLRLIAVVLGCPEPKTHFRESIKLYNWGFARYQAVKLAPAGMRAATLRVERGTPEQVDVLTEREVTIVVRRGEDKGIKSRLELPERLEAPVVKGQRVGNWVVCQNEKEILRVGLVAARDVARDDFWGTFHKTLKRVYTLAA
ncbi:MAG: D-alanyl-D-alanine carboxypeptidase family protein [Bacillota bacterium]